MNEQQIYLTLINHWKEQYRQLHDILNSEQSALEKRDFTSLESLVKEKDRLIKTIRVEQIPAIINQGSIKQPNLAEVKMICQSQEELKYHWQSLMELVDQCHFKNEVNAQLIELITHSTKRMFNLIKGCDPDNNIYDHKGDSKVIKHFGTPISA
ncbi:MAG: flagellar protein FlgN [Enterobacterales bacterium]|nr:flagellar protein FlgN [Enterobacterales bacterium]